MDRVVCTVCVELTDSANAPANRPISQSDAMIAAIARSHHAVVATRNTNDFELCGIRVVDP